MNILFLIGNGFDINIGIKSKYSDFYKYYNEIKSENALIKDLKTNISESHENWSDLELALGDYCKKLKNINELDIIIEDIGEKLSIYLEKEENDFDYSKLNREKIISSFSFPEKSLLPAEKQDIIRFKNKFTSNPTNINVISFNYTNSIEKILGKKYENSVIGKLQHNKDIIFRKILHIHGYKDNRMILGVNDTTQINNKSFHDNIDIIETIVKPESNKAVKDNIDVLCKAEISKADLICIFGSSIGNTDNLWWELITNRLLNPNTKLIIFQKSSKPISERISQKNQREVRKTLEHFLSKTSLNDEDKNYVQDNIIVSINSDIFDLK